MKYLNDPDLRYVSALCELDGAVIEAFLENEDLLNQRHRTERVRRLGALAACLALAGGAGVAVYTGTLDPGPTPADTAAGSLPGVDASLPVETEPTQTDKTTERGVIYAKEGFDQHDTDRTDTFLWYVTPHNQDRGTVFCYDALKEALEENTSDDDLFAVLVYPLVPDEFYISKGIRTRGEDAKLWSSYRREADNLIQEYRKTHFEKLNKYPGVMEKPVTNVDDPLRNDAWGFETEIHEGLSSYSCGDPDCELCRDLIDRLNELWKALIDELYGTDCEPDWRGFFAFANTKSVKERKAALEEFMRDYLGSYQITSVELLENYSQWTQKTVPGLYEHYPEFTHFDPFVASVKATRKQLEELIACKNFDLFRDAKEIAWSLELASEAVEDHDQFRYARRPDGFCDVDC